MRGAVVVRWGPYAVIPLVLAVYAVMSGRLCSSCPLGLWDIGRSGTASAADASRSDRSVRGLVLPGIDGKPVRLDAQLGKPLIVDIWATWCGPCRMQRQVLAQLESAGEVRVVAASVDDDPATVRAYVQAHGSLGADAMATQELVRTVGGVEALPTLVWVDAAGNIREVTVGALTAEEVRQRYRKLSD